MHSSFPQKPLLKAKAHYSNSVENGLFSVLMVKNVSSIGMFVLLQGHGEYIFFPEVQTRTIIIGYIGPHLPTVSDPT
jgi:hypothetical protein